MHLLCGRPSWNTDMVTLGGGCGWIPVVQAEAGLSPGPAVGWSCWSTGLPRPILLALLSSQVPQWEGTGIWNVLHPEEDVRRVPVPRAHAGRRFLQEAGPGQ